MFMKYTYNTYPVDCNFLQIMNYVKVTWIMKKVIYLLGNTLQPVNNWIIKYQSLIMLQMTSKFTEM